MTAVRGDPLLVELIGWRVVKYLQDIVHEKFALEQGQPGPDYVFSSLGRPMHSRRRRVNMQAAQIMTRPAVTVGPDTKLGDAVRLNVVR